MELLIYCIYIRAGTLQLNNRMLTGGLAWQGFIGTRCSDLLENLHNFDIKRGKKFNIKLKLYLYPGDKEKVFIGY